MGPDAESDQTGGVSHPRRSWGYWTEAKLKLLADYLDAFTTASKALSERIYLDLFAGEGRGVSRTTGEVFDSSPRIALEVSDPPFTHLRLFELEAPARRLQAELERDYPGRPFEVIPGDCNQTVGEVSPHCEIRVSPGRRRSRSSTPTAWTLAGRQ